MRWLRLWWWRLFSPSMSDARIAELRQAIMSADPGGIIYLTEAELRDYHRWRELQP